MVGWLIVEELGDQIEGLIAKPQPVEDHRFDGFAHGEVTHFRILLGGLVDNVANAKFVEHACDKTKMV